MTSNIKLASIRRQLNQLQRGGNWLAEDFHKKLKNVAPTDAFHQPAQGVHSVAEIVWHCAYWHKVTIERLTGNPGYRDESIASQNFLPLQNLKTIGWEELQHVLDRSFEELDQVIANKDDSFLQNEYEPGKSFEFVLLGTVEHDAYHLGQIGLVIKILSTPVT